ncbi:MAG: HNH endonuclease [Candidatus Doudnabacteria bacterium]|nr:HNH endonuclease [Candidatus Doudnabacteria bacterium]
MPQVECKVCKKSFHIKPFHYDKGWGKYCSKECQNKSQMTGKHVLCAVCSREIWKMQKEIRHSKSQNFFCNKSCQTKWRNTIYVGERHPSWINGINTYRKIMERHNISPICTHCKISNARVLIVHHIDHNRSNNNISNLMWLCRNCHYLIHEGKTF